MSEVEKVEDWKGDAKRKIIKYTEKSDKAIFLGKLDQNNVPYDGTLTYKNHDSFVGTFFKHDKSNALNHIIKPHTGLYLYHKDNKEHENLFSYDGIFNEKGDFIKGVLTYRHHVNKVFSKEGDKFEGTFDKGKPKKGLYTYKDIFKKELTYEGTFDENGNFIKGILTYRKNHLSEPGDTFDGTFDKGKPKNGTYTFIDGSKKNQKERIRLENEQKAEQGRKLNEQLKLENEKKDVEEAEEATRKAAEEATRKAAEEKERVREKSLCVKVLEIKVSNLPKAHYFTSNKPIAKGVCGKWSEETEVSEKGIWKKDDLLKWNFYLGKKMHLNLDFMSGGVKICSFFIEPEDLIQGTELENQPGTDESGVTRLFTSKNKNETKLNLNYTLQSIDEDPKKEETPKEEKEREKKILENQIQRKKEKLEEEKKLEEETRSKRNRFAISAAVAGVGIAGVSYLYNKYKKTKRKLHDISKSSERNRSSESSESSASNESNASNARNRSRKRSASNASKRSRSNRKNK